MSKEFINEKHFASQASIASLEHPPETKEILPGFKFDPSSCSIASCKDYPLSIPSSIFNPLSVLEIDPTTPSQELQKKQKESFLRRLTLANMKVQLTSFLNKVRDTIVNWGNDTPVQEKKELMSLTPSAKKAVASKSTKMEKMKESVSDFPVSRDDLENRRIKEIEEAFVSYEFEMGQGRASMNSMIEMAGKIIILLSSLGYRFNKKEMQDYLKHLEANVKQRVKTFQGGKMWTYVSVGIQGGAAILSLGNVAGGFLGSATLTGLGQAAPAIGGLANSANALGEVDREKRTGERTWHEFGKETIETWKHHNSGKLKKSRMFCNKHLHHCVTQNPN